MLKPPKGDWIGLMRFAHETGTTENLINRLEVLNQYGDDWRDEYRTEIDVREVNFMTEDIDVRVTWENSDGSRQFGGLLLEPAGNDSDGNQLYAWRTRQ